MSPDNNGRATDAMKTDLGEAGQHFKGAAVAAGDAIKGAATAAGDEMRLGKAQMKAELADGTLSSISAAENLGAASREQVDAIMDKGRDLIDSAAELIRERPLASFGVAFAAGWIIAKLGRSSDK
ncbi:hypothetical protein LF41_1798 [Lysobacter dokdonensis DS-58]|uniref:DUF883 domain containing protein n=1 Tax=Lysobacter dokdonensis DS-58 TaxID=1300345 RepID=A0A0A2WY29_9GAMM|nr:hypothetical protein [Lysobacter dokdonensis]KGQ17944.1 hypothetical protein LF41_1798 [Lysobacter dokdonensis DS-58]